MNQTPLIKGMFVNSHIRALRAQKGEAAVRELERRYGKSIQFRNLSEVPVREEVAIIELILDILGGPADPAERAFEAGRLHFRNFMTTPFGKILQHALPKNPDGFRKLLLSARPIARHVFRNTNFKSYETGPCTLHIIMENNDYPIGHFRGLFYEWMIFWGLAKTTVVAEESAPRCFEYTLRWCD